MDPRKVLESIMFVLRTGCRWKALPKTKFGSASSVHKYFLEWKRKGVFVEFWRKGLAECDEMEGIAWSWQGVERSKQQAAMGLEAVDPARTGGRKKRVERMRPFRRAWNPAVTVRERSPSG